MAARIHPRIKSYSVPDSGGGTATDDIFKVRSTDGSQGGNKVTVTITSAVAVAAGATILIVADQVVPPAIYPITLATFTTLAAAVSYINTFDLNGYYNVRIINNSSQFVYVQVSG